MGHLKVLEEMRPFVEEHRRSHAGTVGPDDERTREWAKRADALTHAIDVLKKAQELAQWIDDASRLDVVSEDERTKAQELVALVQKGV